MSLKMILTHYCNYIIKHLEKSKCFFRAQKGVKNMFIWEWVLIALGWLVFLPLVSFIFLFMKNLNKELKNRK